VLEMLIHNNQWIEFAEKKFERERMIDEK